MAAFLTNVNGLPNRICTLHGGVHSIYLYVIYNHHVISILIKYGEFEAATLYLTGHKQ